VNDEVIGTYNMREKYIVLFENNDLKDVATLEVKLNGDFVYYQPIVASFDEDLFKILIDKLKTNEMELIEFKDGYVKGSINSENGDILYTSIPFEPGWSAKINGVRVPIKDLFGSFIGLELNPGENIIELRYTPPYLRISLLISLIGLGLSYLYFKKEKKLVKTISALVLKYIEIINYLIVGFLTTAVSVIVYYIFTRYFGIYYLISEAISWIFAVTFAFFMNKKYVFHSKEKNIIKELINFFNYRLLSLFIDISLMYSLVSIIKIDDLVSKILVQITVIVLNYYFSKKFVFKK
jgi:putative flippase GtrA